MNTYESRIKNQESREKGLSLLSIIRDSCVMIPSRGFTLIELLIVIVVISVLSSMATASFYDYQQSQSLRAAVEDVIVILNTAKSNTLSQVKNPSLCAPTDILSGYKVIINNSTTYQLNILCGAVDTPIMNPKTLPPDITFPSPPMILPSSFLFTVLTGGVVVVGSPTITLSGYGKTRNISVSSTGVIR